jgi:hypothetical protein
VFHGCILPHPIHEPRMPTDFEWWTAVNCSVINRLMPEQATALP